MIHRECKKMEINKDEHEQILFAPLLANGYLHGDMPSFGDDSPEISTPFALAITVCVYQYTDYKRKNALCRENITKNATKRRVHF